MSTIYQGAPAAAHIEKTVRKSAMQYVTVSLCRGKSNMCFNYRLDMSTSVGCVKRRKNKKWGGMEKN
jgi:hypothetical protein